MLEKKLQVPDKSVFSLVFQKSNKSDYKSFLKFLHALTFSIDKNRHVRN